MEFFYFEKVFVFMFFKNNLFLYVEEEGIVCFIWLRVYIFGGVVEGNVSE